MEMRNRRVKVGERERERERERHLLASAAYVDRTRGGVEASEAKRLITRSATDEVIIPEQSDLN